MPILPLGNGRLEAQHPPVGSGHELYPAPAVPVSHRALTAGGSTSSSRLTVDSACHTALSHRFRAVHMQRACSCAARRAAVYCTAQQHEDDDAPAMHEDSASEDGYEPFDSYSDHESEDDGESE